MSELDILYSKLDKLTNLRTERDIEKKVLDDMDAQIDQLRAEILQELGRANISTLKNDHLMVLKSPDLKTKITDPMKVLSWLKQNGFNPVEYQTLNTTMVKPIVAKVYKEDGEIIPGTEAYWDEKLTVSENKKRG
jgi:hypothetical protein